MSRVCILLSKQPIGSRDSTLYGHHCAIETQVEFEDFNDYRYSLEIWAHF